MSAQELRAAGLMHSFQSWLYLNGIEIHSVLLPLRHISSLGRDTLAFRDMGNFNI